MPPKMGGGGGGGGAAHIDYKACNNYTCVATISTSNMDLFIG